MNLAWHEEAIQKRHDRDAFDCGETALNEFLQRHARKSHEMGGPKTFLEISPASIAYAHTPELIRRGLARHEVPAFRLARLAVDLKVHGQRLGGRLLLSAGKRCLLASAEVGGVAMLVDAKNARVAAWYAGYGAIPLMDAPLSLLLPLTTVEGALRAAGKLTP